MRMCKGRRYHQSACLAVRTNTFPHFLLETEITLIGVLIYTKKINARPSISILCTTTDEVQMRESFRAYVNRPTVGCLALNRLAVFWGKNQ